jgi:quercetin dioxygenase-like cupin family protein
VVLEGKARMRLDGVESTVTPGTLLYVQAATEHSFFEIEEDMLLLVFFAAGQAGRN